MTLSKLVSRSLFTSATLAAAIGLSTACSYAAPQSIEPGTHQVDVVFTNIQSQTGMIWARLCTKEQHESRGEQQCEMSARVDATDGATLSFNDVPSGIYAISAYHDNNANAALDFDTRGIPFEPTGNSGNARGFFGPPSFNQMKFRLSGSGEGSVKEIAIKMSTVDMP